MSTTPLSSRHNVYLVLITVSLLIIGLGSGVTRPLAENVVAQTTGICDRTEEVAEAVVAEVQNSRAEATCADITEDELGSIEGPLSISPSDLQAGDFAGLSAVRNLDIEDGDFRVLRSGTFQGLSGLERLTVNSDSVTTIHSGALDDLDKLTNLHLHGDNIKALPRDIFQGMNRLDFLLLHGDSITSLPIGVFDGLERLRVLDLHNQNVKGLSNGVLAGIPNLRTLHYQNQNTGVLQSGVFRGLGKLELLYLEGSGISKIGSNAFSGLDSLRRLHLNGNELESIPGGVFRDLDTLRLLHLHGNSLQRLPADAFEGLHNLNRLYIHGNRIDRLPSDVFRGLGKVTELHLHNNDLTELPNDLFKSMRSLEELFLHENQLTDISDLDLTDQSKLEWFSVHGNMLTALPEDLLVSPPCSLKAIDIDDNEFESVPSITLDGINYNLIDTLPQPRARGCASTDGMTGLFLRGVPLTNEEIGKIKDNYSRIELLRISETGMSGEVALDLLTNGALRNLEGLDLSNNDLSSWNDEDAESIAAAFSRFTELEALDMTEASVDGDTALHILSSTNPELQRFSFSDNDLKSWNDVDASAGLTDAFSRLSKSSWTLILLENAMINSKGAGAIIPSIARVSGKDDDVGLYLSGNQLTEIRADWFAGWEVLSDLDLSDNQLTIIDPMVFAPLADFLEVLNLEGNPLKPIPTREEFEAVLPNLRDLTLPAAEMPEPEPTVEVSQPSRLPATGGVTATQDVAWLLLLIGAAVLIAGVSAAVTARQRSRQS